MGSDNGKIVTTKTRGDGSFVLDFNHESDTVKISSAQQNLILEPPVTVTIEVSPPGSSAKPKLFEVNFIKRGTV